MREDQTNSIGLVVTLVLFSLLGGLLTSNIINSKEIEKLEQDNKQLEQQLNAWQDMEYTGELLEVEQIIDCYTDKSNRLNVSFKGMKGDTSYCVIVPSSDFDF